MWPLLAKFGQINNISGNCRQRVEYIELIEAIQSKFFRFVNLFLYGRFIMSSNINIEDIFDFLECGGHQVLNKEDVRNHSGNKRKKIISQSNFFGLSVVIHHEVLDYGVSSSAKLIDVADEKVEEFEEITKKYNSYGHFRLEVHKGKHSQSNNLSLHHIFKNLKLGFFVSELDMLETDFLEIKKNISNSCIENLKNWSTEYEHGCY